MATYNELTDQEKQDYEKCEIGLRGRFSSLAGGIVSVDELVKFYTDRVVPIKAQLDADEGAPKQGGLAGSTNITHEELTQALTWLNDLETDIENNLTLFQKIIGVDNARIN